MKNNPTWIPVVALALDDGEGRWLMQKRPQHKHHGGLWEFPGGKVENGETPANALIREIREGLDLVLEADRLTPAVFAQENGRAPECPIVILLYTCCFADGAPQAMEGGAVDWFTPRQIEALAKPPLDRQLAQSLFAKMPD